MATKLALTTITTGYNSGDSLNSNFQRIAAEFDNCLSLDGTSPNQMGASLDMNGNRVINIGAPATNTDACRLVDVIGVGAALPVLTGNVGKVLRVNATEDGTEWFAVTGTGTVTSVNVSGGTTGLSFTGGPVTTSGTITATGTLAVANGGTGVTTSTGTGSTVRSTSPSLDTPALTTPSISGNVNHTAAGNAGYEIGRTDGSASTPYIDFHSGSTAVDYDSRIVASGGTGSIGGGTLTVNAATVDLNSTSVWTGDVHADRNDATGVVYLGNGGDNYVYFNGADFVFNSSASPTNASVYLTQGRLRFPSTANPSTNANTLDEYKEGTFSPTMRFSGFNTGMVGTFTGYYTKIGRIVHANGVITLSSKGSSVGNVEIDLPSAYTVAGWNVGTVYWAGGTALTDNPICIATGSIINVYGKTGALAYPILLTDTYVANNQFIYFTITYMTSV